MSDALIGTRLGNFELTGRLGAGGMGEVFAGKHAILGHQVAVKLMRPARLSNNPEQAVQRFITEARALTQIRDSSHVIKLHDFGRMEGGALYYVMEHLEGHDLEHELAGRLPLGPLEALRYVEQIGAGLAAAHRQGIVHRDLKPANVFVCRGEEGEGPTLKLIDFGIAKDLSTEQQITVGSIGTPYYAAPEQVAGETVSPATDIYALGVMLYQMLTGAFPFDVAADASPLAVLLASREKPPISAAQRVPSLPPGVVALLDRCLAKDPAQRPGSAPALCDELRALLAPAPLPATVVHAAGTPAPDAAPAAVTPAQAAVTPVQAAVAQPATAQPAASPVKTATAQPAAAPPGRGRTALVLSVTVVVVGLLVVGVLVLRRPRAPEVGSAAAATTADASLPGSALEAPSKVQRTVAANDAAPAKRPPATKRVAPTKTRQVKSKRAMVKAAATKTNTTTTKTNTTTKTKRAPRTKKGEPRLDKREPRPKTKRKPLIDSDDVLPP